MAGQTYLTFWGMAMSQWITTANATGYPGDLAYYRGGSWNYVTGSGAGFAPYHIAGAPTIGAHAPPCIRTGWLVLLVMLVLVPPPCVL